MANSFVKEEVVAFEQMGEKFEDALILSRNVNKYATDQTMMARTGDIIWRPQPYIATSYSGTDASANFKQNTQLAVPSTIGYERHSTATMTALELRDALQEGRLGQAAAQKLASDVNVAVMNVAANYGTLVVKRTTPAAGFDDVAQCEAIFNEQGVQQDARYAAYSTRDYNGMASNLANRQTMTGKPTTAYEKAYVGTVASFETYKLDYANRLAAASGGGGITIDTQASASNYYIPRATSVATTGEQSNVDNRFQTVTVSSTTNVRAGDAFTAGGVEATHHITKGGTGQLKSFRVISVLNGTQLVISPPMISNQGNTQAEAQYQNVIVTPSGSAPLVWLNTTLAAVNPFWHKDAIELLPGRYAVPTDAGAAVMRTTTEQGIELCMQKWYDIKTMMTLFRWDIRFGVVMAQPEMAGIELFGQA